MDDRSGFRLFWKSFEEPSPACEEKKDELKQVRGRGRPSKAPAIQGLLDKIPREATVTDEPN